MHFIIVATLIFAVNIVFGYWRANTRKLSLQWVGAIHIPVPVAIGLRLWLLGWNWFLIPVFVLDFAAGQFTGGRARNLMQKSGNITPTSWIIGDAVRAVRISLGNRAPAAGDD
jgi:hypothetical protein